MDILGGRSLRLQSLRFLLSNDRRGRSLHLRYLDDKSLCLPRLLLPILPIPGTEPRTTPTISTVVLHYSSAIRHSASVVIHRFSNCMATAIWLHHHHHHHPHTYSFYFQWSHRIYIKGPCGPSFKRYPEPNRRHSYQKRNLRSL